MTPPLGTGQRRRSALGVLAWLLVIAALVAVRPDSASSAQAQVALEEQPNVVVFLTDDMRADDLRFLPQTRQLLGANGVTFRQSYSPNPVCCPARASLVTAQFSHNSGVHSNTGLWGGMQALEDPDDNLGAWLQDAGYRTAYVGKYLNGYPEWRATHATPAGWDHFDATVDYLYHYVRYVFESAGRPVVLDHTNTGLDEQGRPYITRAETEIMDGYIDEYAGGAEPFFLLDSILAPHGAVSDGGENGPAIPEPAYAHLYADHPPINPATRSDSFWDQSVHDVPQPARRRTPAEEVATARALAQLRFVQRLRTLASVDDHVAAVVARLAETGELDSTVLVFTSDNGYMLGEHGYLSKFLGYEESLRVPLLISGPGFPSGVTSSHPVTTVDVASTIVELTGVTPGRPSDGRSVLDLLDDAEPRAFPIEGSTQKDSDTQEWGWQGVHWGRYTYVLYWAGGEELYDTRRSRWQEENLIDNPRYVAVLRELRTRADELSQCQGVTQCHPPSARPPRPAPEHLPSFRASVDRTVVAASGSRSVQVQVRVSGAGTPAQLGSLGLLVDQRSIGPAVPIGDDGRATVSWDPPRSAAGRSHTLQVVFDGADRDLRAGTSGVLASIRVRP